MGTEVFVHAHALEVARKKETKDLVGLLTCIRDIQVAMIIISMAASHKTTAYIERRNDKALFLVTRKRADYTCYCILELIRLKLFTTLDLKRSP